MQQVLRIALRALYPCADAVVGMVARHLPSPLEQQRVRAPHLYVPRDEPSTLDSNSDDDDDDDNAVVQRPEPIDASKDLLGVHDDQVMRGRNTFHDDVEL
jgi:hypothetical protein